MKRGLNTKVQQILVVAIALIMVIATIALATIKSSKKFATVKTAEQMTELTYDQLNDEDEYADQNHYVKFGAFFTKDLDGDGSAEKVLGTCKEVNNTDTLYIDIGVEQNGHLDNGVITISGSNFTYSMEMIKDTVLKENYVSTNVRAIELNNIYAGTQELIMGVTHSSITIPADYSQVNSIRLTGTHIANDGTETAIDKTVNVTVDWYGTATTTTSGYVSQVDTKEITGDSDIVLTYSFSVETKGLYTQEQDVTATVPTLLGYNPKEVNVESPSYATSEYDDAGHTLTINYETSANKNTYKVQVTYPKEAYDELMTKMQDVNSLPLSMVVVASSKCYNNPKEGFENPYITDSSRDIATVSIENNEDVTEYSHVCNVELVNKEYLTKPYNTYAVSKQDILQEYDKEEPGTIEYTVKWEIGRKDTSTPRTTLEIEDDTENGDSFDKNIYLEDYTPTKAIYFGATDLIPNNGTVKVIDSESGAVVKEFTDGDWKNYTSSNPFELEIPIKDIKIETSEDKQEKAWFNVYLIRELDVNAMKANVSRQQIESAFNFWTGATFKGSNLTNNFTVRDKAALVVEKSQATILLSQESIETTRLTPLAERLTINIPSYDVAHGKFKDARFLIRIPTVDIAYLKVNNVTSSSDAINIDGFDMYKDGDYYFVRIITSNDEELAGFNIYVDCDLLANPMSSTTANMITLNYSNESCPIYYNDTTDRYDINGNDSVIDTVGYADTYINVLAPSSFVSTETITDYNEDSEVTISPNIAEVSRQTRQAKINVMFANNYTDSVTNVKILGRIPFEGNNYVEGESLASEFTTTMTNDGLVLPRELLGKAQIYYSTQGNTSKDLTDANNDWKTKEELNNDLSGVKTYLIVIDSTAVKRGTKYNVTYDVKIPEGLPLNVVSYSCHKIYFDINTEEGLLSSSIQPNKVGVRIAEYYNMNIKKVKKDTSLGVLGAVYQIAEDKNGEEDNKQIAISNTQGNMTFTNLRINQVYILREIFAPKSCELNTEPIKFVIEETNNTLSIRYITEETFKGNVNITETEGERTIASATIEDMPKVRLTVNKIDKDTNNGLSGVTFKCGSESKMTDSNGQVVFDSVSVGREYTFEELYAKTGYYPYRDPMNFTVNMENGVVSISSTSDIFQNAVITNSDQSDYIEVSITMQNEKVPTYNLKVVKVNEYNTEEKIANTRFMLKNVETGNTLYYRTDANGEINVRGLYQYVEGKPLTGEYLLKEVEASEGYVLNDKEIKFVVSTASSEETSENNQGEGQTGEISGSEQSEDEENIQITFEDSDIVSRWVSSEIEDGTVKLTVADKPVFRVVKVDRDTGEPLANVEFFIKEVDATNTEIDYAKNVRGEYVGTQDESGKYIVTTNEHGEIVLPLRSGKYKITENATPEGYQTPTGPQYFIINGNKYEEEEKTYLGPTRDDFTYSILDTIEINNIEDLVDLQIASDNGEAYDRIYVKMTRNLDFNDPNSYRNSQDTSYGDINGNGEVESIKDELTNREGTGFKPIGDTIAFGGIFDGQGHEIKNIYINRTDVNNAGLFGNVNLNSTVGGKVQSLGLTGTIIANDVNYVGGIVANTGNAWIIDSYNKANITVTNSNNSSTENAGVVAGVGNVQYIRNCYNSGTITVNSSRSDKTVLVSGIGGTTKIASCYNRGNITVNGAGVAAGISATQTSAVQVQSCYNTGNVVVNVEGEETAVAQPITCASTRTNVKNSYYLDGITIVGTQSYEETSKTSEEMKQPEFVSDLVNVTWVQDTDNKNDGYPILKGTLIINSVEDLVRLSEDMNRTGDYYTGLYVSLNRSLDFMDDNSYDNPNDTSFGDLNNDGEVKGIKEEVTDSENYGFKSIGNYYFEGIFNGNENKIENYYAKGDGLFYYVRNSQIMNLTVKCLGNDFSSNAGSIAGSVQGNCIIENCVNTGDLVKHNGTYIGTYAGGITGYTYGNNFFKSCINYGNINGVDSVGGIIGNGSSPIVMEDCANYGSISGSSYVGGCIGLSNSLEYIRNFHNYGAINGSDYVGGFLGRANNGQVIDSSNEGAINSGGYYTGGIVAFGAPIIENSYNTANIVCTGTEGGNFCLGGLAGDYQGDGYMKNSWNSGEILVTGQTTYCIGGLSGRFGPIYSCYNTGKITISQIGIHNIYIGGLVGDYAGVYDSYNTGDILILDNASDWICTYIGGIAGDSGPISNCKNSGNITLPNIGGGYYYIGGINGNSGTVTDSYNEGNIVYNANGSKVDTYTYVYASGISAYGGATGSYNKGNITVNLPKVVQNAFYEVAGIARAGANSCRNDGNIRTYVGASDSSTYFTVRVGGITAEGGASNCCNNGNIQCNSVSTGQGTSYSMVYAGGITADGSVSNSYNTGNVSNYPVTTNQPLRSYTGGVVGNCNSTISDVYNTGTILNEIYGYNLVEGRVGGIAGKASSVKNTYNVGEVTPIYHNLPTTAVTSEGIIAGNITSGEDNFYLDTLTVPGTADADYVTASTESFMKDGEMFEALHDTVTSLWREVEDDYPTLKMQEFIPVDAKITEITIENNKITYDITSEVKPNSAGIRIGGTITGENTSTYSSSQKLVEAVRYNENSTKDIVAIPSDGYQITSMTINGEEYKFELSQDGSVTIPAGYFKNVTTSHNVVVEFTPIDQVLVIEKADNDGNPVSGAEFSIDQIEDRTAPDSSVIGSVTGVGPSYTKNYNNLFGTIQNSNYYLVLQPDGTYKSNNQGVNNSTAAICVPINLTEQTGTYKVKLKATVWSESNYDWAYATITDSNTTVPAHSATAGRFLHISGNYSADTTYTSDALQGGQQYYLWICYSKDGSRADGNDTMVLNTFDLYRTDLTEYSNYGFEMQDGKYVSTNKGEPSTIARSSIPIDLTGYRGKYKVIVNAELSSKTNVDAASLKISSSDFATQTMCSIKGVVEATDYEAIVEGGGIWNLQLEYNRGKGKGTDHNNDEFKINSIRFELDDSDFVHKTGLKTDEKGIINVGLRYGTYRVVETKAPDGYVLDSTPVTHIIGTGTDNTIQITNTKLSDVVAHYYLNETGPEYDTEAVQLAVDEYSYGEVGDTYTTRPILAIDNYKLLRRNNKFVIPENASGTFENDTIDVYYYYETDRANYTVHYLFDDVEDENLKVTADAEVGSVISTYEDKVKTGYKLNSVEGLPLTIDQNEANNNIYVRYVKDSFDYTVHYFYDGVENVDNKIESRALFGSTIEEVPDKNITGYKHDHTDGLPLTISEAASENVVNVYYVKDNFAYEVHYFYDGDDDESKTEFLQAAFESQVSTYPDKNITGYKLDSEKALNENGEEVDLPLTIRADTRYNRINVYYVKDNFDYTVHYFYDNVEDTSKKIEDTALFGSQITEVPDKNIAGYKHQRIDGLPLTISATPSENVINVYYVKDNFGYTVHYFYDNVEDTSKKIEDTALFGSQITEVPDKNIAGYKHDHTDGLPLTISTTASENVVNVYYIKDNIGYTVHYFYDETEDTSKKIESTALFGSKITEVPDKNIIGYKHDHTDGLPLTISAVASENVVNVYYVKDNFGYTVHYFYDNVEDESKKIESTALFGSTITEVPDKNIAGYKHQRTEGLPLTISATESENVVNVYYIPDELGYSIHYFYDGVEDTTKVVNNNATFGSVITVVDVETNRITGYKHDYTDGLPLTISAVTANNVINVYYVKDSFGYTVHYFYDNVEDESKKIEDTALFGSVISEVPEKGKEGYNYNRTEGLPLTISAVVSENVVNVYYTAIPHGTVTVTYIDNITGEKIIPDKIIDKEIGSGYTVTREVIPGYRLDEEHLPTNETGTVQEVPQTVTYQYIELRPYDLVVRYSSGEGEHDEAKVLVHFGETTINDYTTNGELHIADIELTDLVTETYTVYETETPEYCKPVVTEETPAVVELTGRLNTEENKYEYVANYGDIEGFEVIVDETNKKVIFDIRAEKNEKYDLAIRKFITKIGDKEITDRVPQVLISEDNKITYLGNNNIEEAVNSQEITYTIRMYNESEVRARGKQIVEYVPEGLVFVPENSINKQYSWKMYKVGANGEAVEVTDAKEATVVVTDYLVGKPITAFNTETKEVSYLDVQAVFKVDESRITRADRIVENKVQIVPNKNDDNSDNDTSTEKVYVKYFDLSVEKYIQRVVVNTNGNETTREVGYEKKGELVKVDVKNSEAKNTKLTITYGILVKNVGEIPGYATEITDYIPEDFKLLSTDEWTLNGNTAVSTKLSDKLLNPGESATLEVTFEWDLANGNVGTRRNEAEITEYANDFDAEDVTKDNKDGEDILVTLKTGSEEIAGITAIAVFTAVVALGVLVIKRKVTKH